MKTERTPFRAGDHVRHVHIGETWVLACDQNGDEVICAGWPESVAKAEHCTLVRAATDAERLEMLSDCAKLDGLRGSWARRQSRGES